MHSDIRGVDVGRQRRIEQALSQFVGGARRMIRIGVAFSVDKLICVFTNSAHFNVWFSIFHAVPKNVKVKMDRHYGKLITT